MAKDPTGCTQVDYISRLSMFLSILYVSRHRMVKVVRVRGPISSHLPHWVRRGLSSSMTPTSLPKEIVIKFERSLSLWICDNFPRYKSFLHVYEIWSSSVHKWR